jgi:hypothetical protein
MDQWKQTFAKRLSDVQARWAVQFDDTLDNSVNTVFHELADFLLEYGITAAIPMQEPGRRSFKFELAEDAYLLVIFRSRAVDEFELSRQSFALGSETKLRKSTERLSTVTKELSRREFQAALDAFIELLGGPQVPTEEELAAV